jgi:hypothetical protein
MRRRPSVAQIRADRQTIVYEGKVGRTPWSAADAHVGLFRGLAEPDQGVRRGRGRPPHSLSASEPLSHLRSVAVSFFPQRDIAQQHVSSYRDHHQ